MRLPWHTPPGTPPDTPSSSREYYISRTDPFHFYPFHFSGLTPSISPAGYLKKNWKPITSILDVASGSGVWGIAFAQELQTATVTALDFPVVLKVARTYARKFGVARRFKYLPGDLQRLDFGKQQYDLIILGHICHSIGRSQTIRLLRKSYAALSKGGQVLIADFVPNNQRSGPVFPLMFALNMLLNTPEGDVFTFAEYQKSLCQKFPTSILLTSEY